MGKIYCIMGKSSTGKDTLFKKILGDESLSLKTIVPYTTRPVRAGEKNGVEYFFCDEKKVEELERVRAYYRASSLRYHPWDLEISYRE